MNSIDIISHQTTAELRQAAETYAAVWPGRTEMIPGADRFVRSYLEAPEAHFLSRITPIVLSELIMGHRVPDRLASLAIAINDEDQNWVMNVEVALGQGEEPAVIVGPTVYTDQYKTGRHTDDIRGMAGALTEREGLGLILDLGETTRQSERTRGRFGRAWRSLAKVL